MHRLGMAVTFRVMVCAMILTHAPQTVSANESSGLRIEMAWTHPLPEKTDTEPRFARLHALPLGVLVACKQSLRLVDWETGQALWNRSLQPDHTHELDGFGRIVLWEPTRVSCLSSGTGEEYWSRELSEFRRLIPIPMTVLGDRVFLVAESKIGAFVPLALDSTSGRTLWQGVIDEGQRIIWSSADRVVTIARGHYRLIDVRSQAVLYLDKYSGWDPIAWSAEQGTVAIGYSHGVLYLDAASGKTRAHWVLPRGVSFTERGCFPLNGKMVAFRSRFRDLGMWIAGSNGLREVFYDPDLVLDEAAVQNGVAFLATTRNELLAVEAETGDVRWRSRIDTFKTAAREIARGYHFYLAVQGDFVVLGYHSSGAKGTQNLLVPVRAESGEVGATIAIGSDWHRTPVAGMLGPVAPQICGLGEYVVLVEEHDIHCLRIVE